MGNNEYFDINQLEELKGQTFHFTPGVFRCLTDDKAFIICPRCHHRTKVKAYSDTELKNFPLWCEKCKREFKINK